MAICLAWLSLTLVPKSPLWSWEAVLNLPKITCILCDPTKSSLPTSLMYYSNHLYSACFLYSELMSFWMTRCALNTSLKSSVTCVSLHSLSSPRTLYLITLWTLLLKGSDVVNSWISSCVLLKMKLGIAAFAFGCLNWLFQEAIAYKHSGGVVFFVPPYRWISPCSFYLNCATVSFKTAYPVVFIWIPKGKCSAWSYKCITTPGVVNSCRVDGMIFCT